MKKFLFAVAAAALILSTGDAFAKCTNNNNKKGADGVVYGCNCNAKDGETRKRRGEKIIGDDWKIYECSGVGFIGAGRWKEGDAAKICEDELPFDSATMEKDRTFLLIVTETNANSIWFI